MGGLTPERPRPRCYQLWAEKATGKVIVIGSIKVKPGDIVKEVDFEYGHLLSRHRSARLATERRLPIKEFLDQFTPL